MHLESEMSCNEYENKITAFRLAKFQQKNHAYHDNNDVCKSSR